MSIEATKAGFEASFEEAAFYNKQTQDDKHLNDILETIHVKSGMKILDLGCGSGYLTFPIAKRWDSRKFWQDTNNQLLIVTGLHRRKMKYG